VTAQEDAESVQGVSEYGPALKFRVIMLSLMFGAPLFSWMSGTPLGDPVLLSYWTCALVVAVPIAFVGGVRLQLDDRGVTRIHFWRRMHVPWEAVRAIKVVLPEGRSRVHYWQVLGRGGHEHFRFGRLLGRREKCIAEMNEYLRVHRNARIKAAHEEGSGHVIG